MFALAKLFVRNVLNDRLINWLSVFCLQFLFPIFFVCSLRVLCKFCN